MDFFKQAIAQVRELFRSLTPAARLTTSLLMIVVVISLAYLVTYRAGGSDVYLMGGESFNSAELASMQAALGDAGLAFEVEGSQIKIPQGRDHQYMAALGKAGAIPIAKFGHYLKTAIDGSGMLETSEQKDARLKAGKEMELASIIRRWPGVGAARVIYDVAESKGLNRHTTAKAVVDVTPVLPDSFGAAEVANLKKFVAGAYASLTPENVVVSIGGRTYASGADGLVTAEEDPYYSRKRQYEEDTALRIREQLAWIPGVVVGVNAELDPVRSRSEVVTKHEGRNVAAQTAAASTADNGQGGQTELVNWADRMANAVANQAAHLHQDVESGDTLTDLTGRVATSAQEPNERATGGQTAPSIVNKTTTSTEYAGFVVRSAKATVTVPASYYLHVWQEQHRLPRTLAHAGHRLQTQTQVSATSNTPGDALADDVPTQAELATIEHQVEAKIKAAVAPLLPGAVDADEHLSNVAVVTFADLPGEEIAPLSTTTVALDWATRNWSTLSMMGLAVLGLVTLRSLVRSTSTTTTRAVALATDAAERKDQGDERANTEAEEELIEAERRYRHDTAHEGGPSPHGDLTSHQDDLAEVIRQDPAAAASVLQSWITKAG